MQVQKVNFEYYIPTQIFKSIQHAFFIPSVVEIMDVTKEHLNLDKIQTFTLFLHESLTEIRIVRKLSNVRSYKDFFF